MDFGKSFTFVFEDSDWLKKIAIIALVMLIPVIGELVALGWSLELMRRVMRQNPAPLPDLAFSDQLVLGLKGFVVSLVYALPLIVLGTLDGLAPTVLASGDSQGLAAVVTILMVCCGLLAAVYGLLMLIVLPAAFASFLAADEIAAGFNFREVFGLLRAAPGAYLLTVLGALIGGIIAPLGFIACGIGVLLTGTYVFALLYHLYGQAYRAAVANRAVV